MIGLVLHRLRVAAVLVSLTLSLMLYSVSVSSSNQPAAAPEPSVVLPDATAYYNDFWMYVSYYGEAAARAYYTQWAPPEGTPAPTEAPLPVAPLPHVQVAEPVVDARSDRSTSARVAETTPAIDPAIAAAYEEFKIEVCYSAFALFLCSQ